MGFTLIKIRVDPFILYHTNHVFMMKKFNLLLIFFLILANYCTAQKLHARYENILSPSATYMEHVYFEDGKNMSIRDSIRVKVESESELEEDFTTASMTVVLDNSTVYRGLVWHEVGKLEMHETRGYENQNYLVEDTTFPGIKWNLEDSKEEKFGDYQCKRATADYRGTKLIAYYTEEIPIPAGPNKFTGLPGLIVMVYNEGVFPNYWLLKEVKYPYVGEVPVNEEYIASLPKISLEKFVVREEEKVAQQIKILHSKLPEGVEIETPKDSKKIRGTVEQLYEWEQNKN